MKNLLIQAMFLPRQQATHTHTSLIKFDHTSQQISTKLSVQLHHRSSVFKRSCNSAMTCGEIMLPRQALDLLGSAVLGSWPRLHPQRRDRMSDVEIVPGGCTRHHQTAPNPEAIVTNCHASLPNVPFRHFSRDLHLSSKI
jgi:hypothetical protein